MQQKELNKTMNLYQYFRFAIKCFLLCVLINIVKFYFVTAIAKGVLRPYPSYIIFFFLQFILFTSLNHQLSFDDVVMSARSSQSYQLIKKNHDANTGWSISYRKYILKITQPSQYRYAKLQYRFAVISGSPSSGDNFLKIFI